MSYSRGLTVTFIEEEIMYVLVQVTGVATVRIGGVDSIIINIYIKKANLYLAVV